MHNSSALLYPNPYRPLNTERNGNQMERFILYVIVIIIIERFAQPFFATSVTTNTKFKSDY